MFPVLPSSPSLLLPSCPPSSWELTAGRAASQKQSSVNLRNEMMALQRPINNTHSLEMVIWKNLIHLCFILSGHPFLNVNCFLHKRKKIFHSVNQFSSYIYWKCGTIYSQIIILLQSTRSLKSVLLTAFHYDLCLQLSYLQWEMGQK